MLKTLNQIIFDRPPIPSVWDVWLYMKMSTPGPAQFRYTIIWSGLRSKYPLSSEARAYLKVERNNAKRST